MPLDELPVFTWTISNRFLLSLLECMFCLWPCWEPPENCLYTDFLFLSFFPPSASADCPDSVPSSTETGGTNYLAPGGLSGKTSLVALDFVYGSC